MMIMMLFQGIKNIVNHVTKKIVNISKSIYEKVVTKDINNNKKTIRINLFTNQEEAVSKQKQKAVRRYTNNKLNNYQRVVTNIIYNIRESIVNNLYNYYYRVVTDKINNNIEYDTIYSGVDKRHTLRIVLYKSVYTGGEIASEESEVALHFFGRAEKPKQDFIVEENVLKYF